MTSEKRTVRAWMRGLGWLCVMVELGVSPCVSVGAIAHAEEAQVAMSEPMYTFDIPSQPLSSAIDEFIKVTNWQVGYGADITRGVVSPGVSGRHSAREALDGMLSGTGLTYRSSSDDTVTLERATSSLVAPVVAGAAAGAAAGAVVAASAEEGTSSIAAGQKPVKVPEIFVKDVRERDNDTKSYVAQEDGTAMRTDTPIRDVPQSVQVITRKVIEEQRTFRLQNTLENVSGINATDAALSLYDNLLIRGFVATERSYFRNGLLDPFAQFIASDTYNIRRIEVLKGPAAVLYGQGDPGGIINVVTNKALSEAAYSANVTLGNFNFYRSEIDATGPLNASKTLLYRLNVAGQKANSFIDFANRDLVAVAPSVTWLMGARTALTVDFDYLRRWSNDPYGLPAEGTYLPNINGPLPRNRSVTLGNFSNLNRTSYRVGYDISHQFNDAWSIRNAYRHSIVTDDKNSLYAFPDTLDPDQRTLQRLQVLQPAINRRHADSMITNLIGHLRFLEMDHTLLTGFELRQEKTDQFMYQVGAAPPLDLYAPDYSIPPLPFTDPPNNFLATNRTAGFYMQDQIAILHNLKAVAGLRFDYVHQMNQTAATSDSSDTTAVSPRLGLVYQPIEPVSLYTSWTRGFQPSSPGSFNASGQLFNPERSTQYEVGAKIFALENRVSATLAWFHLTRQNVLTTDPSNFLFQVATGEQRSQGVELDVTARVTPGWNVIASYAYTDAEVTKDNDPQLLNKRLANVPYNKFTIWSTYHFQEGMLRGFGVGGGLFAYSDRNGSIFVDQPVMPGYIRADGAVYYNRALEHGNWLGAKGVDVAVNMRNLLNQRYVATSYNGTPQFLFGEPFTVLATVGIKF
ncbi:Ferrichrome iron receptor [Nitrospira japonica]|uniref:Ferrichrome iron receptor n=2 Tax=Nitrospira japonica TaxID=1325564 RepID=A0A1W1IBD8_9BACT|nr:Ferrichrome iron receptor [Nitrospira japonica]